MMGGCQSWKNRGWKTFAGLGRHKDACGLQARRTLLRPCFNVAEFPEATYKSTGFNFNGDALERVDGQRTLLGVTKPVKLSVTSFKCAPHPFTKKEMCGADVTTRIKRSDFGMKTFVGPVSDDVKLSINVEAYKE